MSDNNANTIDSESDLPTNDEACDTPADEETNSCPSGETNDSADSPQESDTTDDDTSAAFTTDGISARTGDNPAATTEETLEKMLAAQQTTITVVGCGGAGSNTVTRMSNEGIEGATLVALNTDAQHLADVEADSRLLIGEHETTGLGAGAKPWVGEDAAQHSHHEIRDAVEDSDMVFVTAGLGGGTGTGSAPIVADIAQDIDALTIAVVTLPFSVEGRLREETATSGLRRLREATDTVIVVPNDRLLDAAGDTPIQQAFKVSDEVLMRSVKGITEMLTTSGLVNLDFADIQTILERGGVAMIGLGESETDTDTRAQESMKDAIRSPLLDVDLEGAQNALINVTGGVDMTIEEAESIVEAIHDRIDENARIIWGTSIDESLDGTMRTMVIVTGVDSPQIHGQPEDDSTQDQTERIGEFDYVE